MFITYYNYKLLYMFPK